MSIILYRTCSVYVLLFYDKYLSHAYLYLYTCFSRRTSIYSACRSSVANCIIFYYTVTIKHYLKQNLHNIISNINIYVIHHNIFYIHDVYVIYAVCRFRLANMFVRYTVCEKI